MFARGRLTAHINPHLRAGYDGGLGARLRRGKQAQHSSSRFPALLDSCSTRFRIMSVVASLAQCRQIEQVRCFGTVVEDVRHREDHARSGDRVRFVVLRSTPLAPVACAIEAHKPATQFPVLRVPILVLRSDRHCSNPKAPKKQNRSISDHQHQLI